MKTTVSARRIPKMFAALGVLVLLAPTISAKEGGAFVPDQLTCAFVDSAYVDSVNATYGTSVLRYLPQTGSFLLQTQPGQDVVLLSTQIGALPQVVYCTPNYYTDAPEPVQGSQPFIDAAPSIEKYTGQTAGTQIGITQSQVISTGAGVRVGVIDVGVSLSHPALGGQTVSGVDYVDGGPATDPAGGSASGHGTFVAGVIHLVAPAAEIVSYRVMDTAGRGVGFTVAEAILQAVDDGCKVINLSMVMTGKQGTSDFAIEYAKNHNVLVVAAAGNDSTSAERFPSDDSYTLGVAALDSQLHKADFSNFNGKVDLCAPGTNIYAPFLDSSYAHWQGTSFAAPFIAGEAALILSRRPNIQWSELVHAMTSNSAINVDSLNPTFVGQLGDGLANPVGAMSSLGIICGDIDQNAQGPDISDLTALIDYLYISLSPLPDPGLSNVDSFPGIDISDLTRLIDYLYISMSPLECRF